MVKKSNKRCAVQVATETDKMTYYPEKNRQDENNNSTSKNRNKKHEKKITHPKEKRNKKVQVRQGSNRKQKIRKGHTRECAKFCRFQARTLREGCSINRTYTKLKNKYTHSATKNTRGAKKRPTDGADEKLKKKKKTKRSNKQNKTKKQKQIPGSKRKKSKAEDTNRDTKRYTRERRER